MEGSNESGITPESSINDNRRVLHGLYEGRLGVGITISRKENDPPAQEPWEEEEVLVGYVLPCSRNDGMAFRCFFIDGTIVDLGPGNGDLHDQGQGFSKLFSYAQQTATSKEHARFKYAADQNPAEIINGWQHLGRVKHRAQSPTNELLGNELFEEAVAIAREKKENK